MICGCKTTTIPDSVVKIRDYAFMNMVELESIVIPNSVIYIGELVFSSCSSLKSMVISTSVKKIGLFSFSGCYSLEKIYYTGNQSQWEKLMANSTNCGLEAMEIIFEYRG